VSPQPLRRRIGQLLIGSFAGPVIPGELRSVAREFDLGGVTLFRRLGNIETPEQVAGLAFEGRALGAEWPAWIGIDQEGGRVARLKSPFTEWPPMAMLGRSDDVTLAARFAKAMAAEMSAVGISLDYAPVLDIHTNPKNPVIGDRALGETPAMVAKLGRVIIDELQRGGVAACGKHFPGHGDTAADSHEELPIIEHPPDRLRAVEFVPFKTAIEANVAFIMTAHVRVTAIDDERPATLSRKIIYELLREELGFGGVIVSDDLEMNAISHHYTPGEAAVAAVAAGCDALLMCGKGSAVDIGLQVEVLEALIRAVESETLPARRVEDALARNRAAKERFHAHQRAWRPPSAETLKRIVGCEEHQAISHQMSAFA
jgi:beta-N-acetylhexosaminidase